MKFGSIAAFVAFLETRPRAVEEAEKLGLDAAGKMLRREARDMIGEEIPQWADLAPATVQEKQRLGYTGQVSATDPLLRTGELRNSIDYEVGEHKVTLGSTDPIAPFQEHGTAKIPPRPFIGSTMYRSGKDAGGLVANYIMGAVVGKDGPIRTPQRRDGESDAE
jgi:phage gpG-like protein